MVKIKMNGETKEEKFKRIAGARANKILRSIAILRNCSNTQVYTYSESQINKIFKVIEEELRIAKFSFQDKKMRGNIKL